MVFHNLFDIVVIIALGLFYYHGNIFYPQTKIEKPEVDWQQLFNAIPLGIAIQTETTGKWNYCNAELCNLLEVVEPSAAYEKLNKLKQDIHTKTQRTGVNFSKGTFSDTASPSGKIGEEQMDQGNDVLATLTCEETGLDKLFGISDKKILWNKQQAYLYTLKDITEVRKAERVKASSQIKSRILRSLSHELRTPINCILTSLEYCKGKLEGDEDSLANINIALANSNILLNKYNDILVTFIQSLL